MKPLPNQPAMPSKTKSAMPSAPPQNRPSLTGPTIPQGGATKGMAPGQTAMPAQMDAMKSTMAASTAPNPKGNAYGLRAKQQGMAVDQYKQTMMAPEPRPMAPTVNPDEADFQAAFQAAQPEVMAPPPEPVQDAYGAAVMQAADQARAAKMAAWSPERQALAQRRADWRAKQEAIAQRRAMVPANPPPRQMMPVQDSAAVV